MRLLRYTLADEIEASRPGRPLTDQAGATARSRLKHLLKPLVRPIVKPAVQPFFDRVEIRVGPVDGRVVATEQAIRQLQADIREAQAIGRHVPTLLNAISAQHGSARRMRDTERQVAHLAEQLGPLVHDIAALQSLVVHDIAALQSLVDERERRVHERLAQIERRGEFIRTELFYELRYGARGAGSQPRAEPVIRNPEKLQTGDLPLNLGCGHIPLEGFVNVDTRELDGVDVVADVRDLPFEPGSVTEIRSAHLLEHFPVEEIRHVVLPHWHNLLRPGGRLVAVVPDAESMIDAYVSGALSFEDLRRVTFGDQDYDGDFHWTMFSRAQLESLLRDAHFAGVTCVEFNRQNGVSREMEWTAVRPSEPSPGPADGE